MENTIVVGEIMRVGKNMKSRKHVGKKRASKEGDFTQ